MTNTPTPNAGGLVFSFDFELGWGSIENGQWFRREKDGVFTRCRELVPKLIRLLDDLEIPSTWAVVGAMVDNNPSRSLDHLPANYKLMVDAALKHAHNSTFDGIDLFEQVKSSKYATISCHTYSHTRFNLDGVNKSFVEQDTSLFTEIVGADCNQAYFVFPQNIEGHHKTIASYGFDTARRTEYDSKIQAYNTFRRYLNPSKVSESSVHPSGMKMKRGNIFFSQGTGYVKSRAWKTIYNHALSNIKNLQRNQGEFHIWNHPFNFAEQTELMTDFEKLISLAAKLRDANELRISYV